LLLYVTISSRGARRTESPVRLVSTSRALSVLHTAAAVASQGRILLREPIDAGSNRAQR